MADQRRGGGGNDHAWPVISAHGVKRDGDWSTHLLVPFRKLSMRPPGRRNPGDDIRID
jgi:hypothetical protein